MQEFKGTRGPWFAAHNEAYWEIRTGEGRFCGGQVADACASKFSNPEGAEANARLIAAAPDLLEVLMDLVREASKCDIDGRCYSEIHAANWAIAKALGEDQ